MAKLKDIRLLLSNSKRKMTVLLCWYLFYL